MRKVICTYCGKNCELVNGGEIYPHRPDLSGLRFYRCLPCDAYVGCHKPGAWTYINGRKVMSDGTLPFGTVANAPLRSKRGMVHAAFDTFWHSGKWTRAQSYEWLAKKLRIHREICHVAFFDIDRCRQALEILSAKQDEENETRN